MTSACYIDRIWPLVRRAGRKGGDPRGLMVRQCLDSYLFGNTHGVVRMEEIQTIEFRLQPFPVVRMRRDMIGKKIGPTCAIATRSRTVPRNRGYCSLPLIL